MADTYDLAFVQGATLTRQFTWTVDGVVQSLAGQVIRSEVRTRALPTAELIVDLADHITIENDVITLRVPATVTAQFEPRKFKRAAWDLFLIDAADPTEALMLIQGDATLDPSATRTVP